METVGCQIDLLYGRIDVVYSEALGRFYKVVVSFLIFN